MFESVIGNEEQRSFLKDSLSMNKLSHAYLFIGPKGVGKATIAKEFAKDVLKVEELKSSPDYKYICKNIEKKDIVIEQIRKEIIDDIYMVPAASPKKIYIIDDAECLNIASQNAILKTLEEPPGYVCIILIASNTSTFLSTILSRVTQVDFTKVSDEEIKKYMSDNYKIDLNDNLLKFLDGSIGMATDLIEQNLLKNLENIENLYKELSNKNLVNAFNLAKEIDFNNSIFIDYLEHLLFVNGNFFCVKFVEKTKNRLKTNGNYDIVVDSMIIKIIDHI